MTFVLTSRGQERSTHAASLDECLHFETVFEVALVGLGFLGGIFVAVLFVLEVSVVFVDCCLE